MTDDPHTARTHTTPGDAMKRAQVLDVGLQDQLYPHMQALQPLPSIYFPDFIAANQADRCVFCFVAVSFPPPSYPAYSLK